MILVLDFGSQYTQLIARRIRESKVYCEIRPFNFSLEKIKELNPQGIILSGGPASVYQENAPKVSAELFNLPMPILGICYGMGIVNLTFGGEAGRSLARLRRGGLPLRNRGGARGARRVRRRYRHRSRSSRRARKRG